MSELGFTAKDLCLLSSDGQLGMYDGSEEHKSKVNNLEVMCTYY